MLPLDIAVVSSSSLSRQPPVGVSYVNAAEQRICWQLYLLTQQSPPVHQLSEVQVYLETPILRRRYCQSERLLSLRIPVSTQYVDFSGSETVCQLFLSLRLRKKKILLLSCQGRRCKLLPRQVVCGKRQPLGVSDAQQPVHKNRFIF